MNSWDKCDCEFCRPKPGPWDWRGIAAIVLAVMFAAAAIAAMVGR